MLLSGGTTSLLAAPVEGVAPDELTALYRLLLGSGLDITAMNRVRKRFSRWGGGTLAAALAPARVRVFVVSDVIGDDLASIGSGPCVPDPATAADVRAAAGARRALGSHPRRRCGALVTAVGSRGNGGDAKARRPGLRARDPRADRQ